MTQDIFSNGASAPINMTGGMLASTAGTSQVIVLGSVTNTFPTLGANQIFRLVIDAEVVAITAVSGNNYTVTRGYELSNGTSVPAHTNGTTAYHYASAGTYSQFAQLGTSNTFSGAITTNGELTATDFKPTGLGNATAASRYVGATTTGAPTTGTFVAGDYTIDQTGKIWIYSGTAWNSVGVSSSGTVTSVSAAAPPFVVTNASTTPNIGLATTGVTANTFLAGPTSGAAGAATMRVLAQTDIPAVLTNANLSGTAGITSANLANTAVTAGSYTYASLTVNAQGQLTAASSGVAPVTSVTASGALQSSGGLTPAITLASATANYILAAPNGTAGVPTARLLVAADIPAVLTNANLSGTAGITSTNLAVSAPTSAQVGGLTTSNLSASAGIVAGQIASVNPSVLTGTGTIPLAAIAGLTNAQLSGTAGITSANLASTGVTAGSYNNSTITVNAEGQVTAASTGTAPVTNVTGTTPIVSSGGVTPAISINAATASTPGSLAAADYTTIHQLSTTSGQTYTFPSTTATLAALIESVSTNTTSGAAATVPDVTVDTITSITLTAACTLTFPTAVAGKSFILALVQDATGSRTVTWPATVKWAGGTAPTLTTTASKTDTFSFICVDGTNWLGYTTGKSF